MASSLNGEIKGPKLREISATAAIRKKKLREPSSGETSLFVVDTITVGTTVVETISITIASIGASGVEDSAAC